MKKNTLVLILIALMAAFLSACDSDSSVSSMSLEPLSGMESSSSDSTLSDSSAEEWRSSIIQNYLSSKGVSSSSNQSFSSSSVQEHYYAEMGEVCDAWTNRDVSNNPYYDAYRSMKLACGYNITSRPNGQTVMEWLDMLNRAYPEVVTDDVMIEVGQGFNEYDQYLYIFDDAHKYIYVELRMDGNGMK